MVVNILTKMEQVIPRWKIVPTKDVIDSGYKDPIKREAVRAPTQVFLLLSLGVVLLGSFICMVYLCR